ncbi:hypothetical protein [Gracilibacillus timonensis]|uniref:hypothetical protein n=1 Tax=Gracilibacillus timonensis TaxID=1816696 RepID=UPI0008243CFD|nr:hypothetical protein [Gracilibacillus timonensis]
MLKKKTYLWKVKLLIFIILAVCIYSLPKEYGLYIALIASLAPFIIEVIYEKKKEIAESEATHKR